MIKHHSPVSPTADNLFRRNVDELPEFPAGEFGTAEAWRDSDLPRVEISTSLLHRLYRCGALQRVRRVRRPGGEASSPCAVWHMDEEHRARLDEYREQRDSPCGCGHGGIRNLPDSEFYTCTHDDCDVRVTRAEVEQ